MSSKFAKDLKAVLKEVVAYKEGKLDAIAEYIEIPEQPVKYKPKRNKENTRKNH